jgi:hypothetical protein
MPARQRPSSTQFVVSPGAGGVDAVRRALDDATEVCPLAGTELVAVEWSPQGLGPRARWTDILKRVPDAHWAAPVFVVDAGSQFPTGGVTVRFRHPPSAAAQRAFAERHELIAARPNEFVPAQVAWQPRDPRRTYLPSLLAALEKDAAIESAWAQTISRYRR